MSRDGYTQWDYSPYYQPSAQQPAATSGYDPQAASYQFTSAPYSPYYTASAPGHAQQSPAIVNDPRGPFTAPEGEPQNAALYGYGARPQSAGEAEDRRPPSRNVHQQPLRNYRARDPVQSDASRLGSLVYASTLGMTAGLRHGAPDAHLDRPEHVNDQDRSQMIETPEAPRIQQRHTTSRNSYQTPSPYPNVPQVQRQNGMQRPSGLEHAHAHPANINRNHATASVYQPRSRETNPGHLLPAQMDTLRSPPLATPPPRNTQGSPSMQYQPNTGRVVNPQPSERPPSSSAQTEDPAYLRFRSKESMGKSPQTIDKLPMTVDPSQIFDQERYLQRQKEAKEALPPQSANSDGKANESPRAANDTALPHHSRTESATQEQIKSGMKKMIDQMREWKSMDPAMFSVIWEQFKKDQPPSRTSSQAPQSNKPVEAAQSPQSEATGMISPQAIVANIDSSNPTTAKPLTPSSKEPDLGKFPAMRREKRNDTGKAQGHPAQSGSSTSVQQESETQSSGGMSVAGTPAGPQPQGPEEGRSVVDPASAPSMVQGQQFRKETIWPEDKKLQLAETAIRTLMGDQRNAGRSITVPVIIDFLSKNPTYDQLCETFVQRGFIFNKSTFARTLLSTMAGDTKTPQDTTSKRKRDASPEPTCKASKTEAPNVPATNSPDNLVQSIESTEVVVTPTGSNAQPADPAGLTPAISEKDAIGLAKAKRLSAAAAQAATAANSKEAQARKQNFNDLVDLTQMDESDDDEPLPPPGPSLLSASAAHDDPPASFPSSSSNPPTSKSFKQMALDPAIRPAPQSLSQQQPRPLPKPRTVGIPGGAPERQRKMVMALPLDNSKALRRSTYNPATIATYFLIAKGEHPDHRPLNSHLEILMMNFKDVNHKTDLSTFRWDLVDPGDPVDEHGNPIEPSKPPGRRGIETGASPSAGLGSPEPDRLGSPIPGGLLPFSPPAPGLRGGRPRARGRAGRPRGRVIAARNIEEPPFEANDETRALQRAAVGISVAGGAGRGGGAAARPPVTQHKDLPAKLSQNNFTGSFPTFVAVNSPAATRNSARPDHDSYAVGSGATGKGASSSDAPSTPTRMETSGSASAAGPGSSGKRRGRPPKNTPSFNVPAPVPGSADGPKRRGRPPGSKNSPSARKPGRPAKPRPEKVNTTIPADGIGIVIPSRPPSSTPASVSYIEARPEPQLKPKRWKSHPTYPLSTPDADAYVPFKCQWISCKAELHNLDTLQKHVFKVHRDRCYNVETARFSCFWSMCGQIDVFADAGSWQRHITDTHVEELARQLGDGPTTHPAETDYSYLADEKGNRITPLASTSGVPDPLPLYAGRGPTRAYHKAHGNLTPEAKARAEAASLRFHALQAVEAHKEGTSVNKTAEWKDEPGGSGSGSGSESDSSDSSDGDETMQD